jgi:hypothetical protein
MEIYSFAFIHKFPLESLPALHLAQWCFCHSIIFPMKNISGSLTGIHYSAAFNDHSHWEILIIPKRR